MACASIIAGIHGILPAESDAIDFNLSYAIVATFPETQTGQGRGGAAFAAPHVQGDQEQAQSPRRHQESCYSHRGPSAQSGCRGPQSIGVSIEHYAQKAEPDRRRMAILQDTMGELLGQGDSNVDVSCGILRDGGSQICRAPIRSPAEFEDHSSSSSQSTPQDHGAGCI